MCVFLCVYFSFLSIHRLCIVFIVSIEFEWYLFLQHAPYVVCLLQLIYACDRVKQPKIVSSLFPHTHPKYLLSLVYCLIQISSLYFLCPFRSGYSYYKSNMQFLPFISCSLQIKIKSLSKREREREIYIHKIEANMDVLKTG